MCVMKKVAIFLTEQLLEKDMIEKNQLEIYQYGLERLLRKLLNYTIMLLLAVSINMVFPSLLFLSFLLLLRGRTGGYHASTELRCFAGSVGIYLFAMKGMLPLLVWRREAMWLFFLAAIIIIYVLAPVNHPNLDFSTIEMIEYKKRARRVLGAEVLGIVVFTALGVAPDNIVSAVLGMVVCAFLLCIAKITKQEVKVE